ncbi:MAG: tetratricopeptide repeat protein, partial [Deltaproteobacteria bacterium]|nr:tetratricopeptide repeat protein [Deltaproteobacteria bacterium]
MTNNTSTPFPYPELYQRILSLAAMFEGDFSIDWIQELAQSKASHTFLVLEEAIRRGLVAKTGPVGFRFIDHENKTRFRSTFRSGEKTQLHMKIADIILQEDADDSSRALALAPHLLQIHNDVSGCGWLVKAGKSYRNANHYQTAVKCYEKALRDLAEHHNSKADKLFIDAAIGYSKISEVAPNSKAVITALEMSLRRARDARNLSQEALIEMHLAKNQWYDTDFDQALKQFNHAWSLVKDADDPHLEQTAAYFSTFFLFWQGRLIDTIQNYEATAPEVEKYPRSRFVLLTGWVIGSAYCASGQVTQGMGMLDTIYALSQKEKDFYVTCAVSFGIGSVLLSIGRVEEGEKYLNDALDMGTKMTNHIIVAYSLLILADLYYMKGKIDACEKKLGRFFENYPDMHLIGEMVPSLLSLSWAAENGHIKPGFNLSLEKLIKRVQA